MRDGVLDAAARQRGAQETVERNPAQTGVVPIPKRWIVERAYGILMLHRRLVRDYEHLPRSSESRRMAWGNSTSRISSNCATVRSR